MTTFLLSALIGILAFSYGFLFGFKTGRKSLQDELALLRSSVHLLKSVAHKFEPGLGRQSIKKLPPFHVVGVDRQLYSNYPNGGRK